jgi:hypothetical protein
MRPAGGDPAGRFVYGSAMSTITLLVRKDDLAQTRLHETADAPLADGQVRVRIDRFALTSNNITYAAFGDAMNYWQFFPTTETGWGIVPVWGFAVVVQSSCPGVAPGERLYGYWPMADQAVLQPQRLTPAGFADGAAHRTTFAAMSMPSTRPTAKTPRPCCGRSSPPRGWSTTSWPTTHSSEPTR